jgi:DNA processing protein
MSKELIFQIALTQLPNIGPVTAKKLVSYCGGVEAIFHSSERSLRKIPSIGSQLAATIRSQQHLDRAKQELEFIKKHDIQALFYTNAAYPQRLKHYEDSPTLLYFQGTADLNHLRTIAIIGTRQPTPQGLSICEEITEGLQPFNPLIVSGLAYGIDIQAHRTALRNHLDTIAVLGHGLDRIYPFRHRSTAQVMKLQGGLLSEFISKTQPDRENFPRRNRIVAALCDAVVVIESGPTGGSLITARLANQYHKDVFAVPGRPSDPRSVGCNLLIKSHQAALLESVDDLIYTLGWEVPTAQPAGQQQRLFATLEPAEQRVVDVMRNSNTSDFDQLVRILELNPGPLSSLLLALELKGVVKPAPGNRFVLV